MLQKSSTAGGEAAVLSQEGGRSRGRRGAGGTPGTAGTGGTALHSPQLRWKHHGPGLDTRREPLSAGVYVAPGGWFWAPPARGGDSGVRRAPKHPTWGGGPSHPSSYGGARSSGPQRRGGGLHPPGAEREATWSSDCGRRAKSGHLGSLVGLQRPGRKRGAGRPAMTGAGGTGGRGGGDWSGA